MASNLSAFFGRSVLRAGCAAVGLALLPAIAGAQTEPNELGLWFNHTGKGAVQIYRCMQDRSRLCGRIVWLKTLTNDKGQPLTDGHNPKASMRSRSICGMSVLGNLKRASSGDWNGGWVYDPEKGTTYTASIRAKSNTQLTMTGYKGIFFKNHVWKRAPNDLPRCGELESVNPDTTAG